MNLGLTTEESKIKAVKSYEPVTRKFEDVTHQGEAAKKITITISLPTSLKNLSERMPFSHYQYEIQREFELLNEMESDYIIKVLDRYEDKNSDIWVIEQFHSFLSQFPISGLNFLDRFMIFFDVVNGINDLSKKLICHRSLSPSTICIFRRDNRIGAKIASLSTAISLKNKKNLFSQQVSKTSPFSSPELVNSNPHGLATDIWSLGILMNYLFYETLANIRISKSGEVSIELPEGTPEWLKELLQGMIEPRPEKRCTIVKVLDVIKSMNKCKEVLNKYIRVGSKCFLPKQQEPIMNKWMTRKNYA